MPNIFYTSQYKKKYKLQITPLKFGDDWILHPKVLEFGFYPLKFGVFGFYTITFQNLDFTL